MAVRDHYSVIIIGCGIAGASLAYFLAEQGVDDILILEKEEQPGCHATGRSATALMEFEFTLSVRELTVMGGRFLRHPPEGFSETPLLQNNGVLLTFQSDLWRTVQSMMPELIKTGVAVRELSSDEVLSRVPVLNPDCFDGAVFLPENGTLDVHALFWGYIRAAKQGGAVLRLSEEVVGLEVEKDRCTGVVTDKGRYRAPWIVDAAGAWAAKVRELSGVSPFQLTPCRRTMITFRAPAGLDVRDWPLTADTGHSLYFSPESAGLMASPMDEEPMEPGNARPDELTIARTIDRIERVAPALTPRSITHQWAGLRTFAPDRAYVVGEDPWLKGFFWLAGQGGSGIGSSPALGRIAADLIVRGRTDLTDVGPLSPVRFIGPLENSG